MSVFALSGRSRLSILIKTTFLRMSDQQSFTRTTMPTLIEQLPAEIARLEAKFGSDNPYVQQLKEQLRASIATQGKSTQDVYRMQAFTFPNGGTAASSSGEKDEKSK